MGMNQPALHSLNALATELGKDRRTLAKKLAGTPADGMIGGHRGWHLKTALAAIERSEAPESQHVKEIEELAAALDAQFDKIEAEPSLAARRKMLESMNPKPGDLGRLLDRTIGDLFPGERKLAQYVASEIVGKAISNMLSLGQWEWDPSR